VLLCLALGLIRWIEAGRWRDAWICGLLGAVLPSLHVFFVLTYPAFALYAVMRWSEARWNMRQLALFGLLLLIGALLFLPVGLALLDHGGSYSFVPQPRWGELFKVFVWGPPVAGLLVGTALSAMLGSRSDSPLQSSEDVPAVAPAGIAAQGGVFLAVWMFVPLVTLFGVSVATELSVFVGRYLIPAIPAVCLFYAIALRGVASGPARVAAVGVVALASFVIFERPPDDFRGAAIAVNEFTAADGSTPILLASGAVEGEDVNWLKDPERAEYLNAPVEYYPLEGRMVTLPRRLQGHPMTNEIIDPILRAGKPFVAIEWFGNGARILQTLGRRATNAGYAVTQRGFGGVRVAFFDDRRGDRRP
jgi:hypothetical protein